MRINIEARVKELAARKESLSKLITSGVLKPGVHYTNRGTKHHLLKAGSDTLMGLHDLREVEIKVEASDLENGNREYRVYSKLESPDGAFSGTGLRACSTMERNYRFEFKPTGQKPPMKWYKNRNPLDLDGNTEEDPDRFVVRDVKGKGLIFERFPCDNPAKFYNVCLALAHKRAKMGAVISAVGAADLFEIDGEVLTVEYTEYLKEQEDAIIDRQLAEDGDASEDEQKPQKAKEEEPSNEPQKAKEEEPSNEPQKAKEEEPKLSEEDIRFTKLCESSERAESLINKMLIERKRISAGETWKDLKGENKKAVLSQLTYLEERFG